MTHEIVDEADTETILAHFDPVWADDLHRRIALVEQMELDAEMEELNVSDTETVPLFSANPLTDNDQANTPTPSLSAGTPSPDSSTLLRQEALRAGGGPPPNEPGRTGKCSNTGLWRLPEDGEYIDACNYIWPHHMWTPSSGRTRKRRVGALDSIGAVRAEMARLYADFHHERIRPAIFTKAAYVLDCLARVTQMEQKAGGIYRR